jgi:hypothetical protein
MTWIIKNWRIVSVGLMGLALVLLVFGAYFKGHANGYTQAENECNAGKVQTINDNIQIIDEVKNIKRPLDGDYLGWLQSQSN